MYLMCQRPTCDGVTTLAW